MIIEYDSKYDENVKDLLVELQEHLVGLDKEHYNILTPEYRELYFIETMEKVNKHNGKVLLYLQDGKVVGFIAGLINNEKEDNFCFSAPKRGRIEELVVSDNVRGSGIGEKLLKAMEEYLHSVGCESILLAAFAYNQRAIKFYEKQGYHTRMLTMIKCEK